MEELLTGHTAEPRPCRRVDAAAEPAQQPRCIDGGRLRQPSARVEGGVLEDRGDHGLYLVAAGDVKVLKCAHRRVVRCSGNEIAPELLDEEARMVRVRHRKPYRVLPCERPPV